MWKILKTLGLVLAVLLTVGLWRQEEQRKEASFRELTRQAEELESMVASLETEAKAHQRNLAKWYNYNLEQGTEGLEQAYDTILNFGQGRMAVLGVPEWDLKLTIFHGDGGVVSHDPSTPLPIGGRGNHTVLRISQQFPWQAGQNLYIECLGQRIRYRVESVQVMDADWNAERSGSGNQDLLTLVFDGEENRMMIRCIRCGELVIHRGKTVGFARYAVQAAGLPAIVFSSAWLVKQYVICVRKGQI